EERRAADWTSSGKAVCGDRGGGVDGDIIAQHDGVDRAGGVSIQLQRKRAAIESDGVHASARGRAERAGGPAVHVAAGNTRAVCLQNASIQEYAAAHAVSDSPS